MKINLLELTVVVSCIAIVLAILFAIVGTDNRTSRQYVQFEVDCIKGDGVPIKTWKKWICVTDIKYSQPSR